MRMQVTNPLYFIVQFFFIFVTITEVSAQCRRDQQSSLIQLKNELEFTFSTSSKLSSWNQTRDCCQWGGVGCDVNGNGRVIDLDLSSELISGGINQTSSLFSLQFLQRLNLGNNRFNSSPIPSGIGNLTELRYLNLTSCGLTGQIPFELSRLTQLVVLDLSSLYFTGAKSLYMENPNFMMLVMNMTALEELYLDGVNISANGNDLGQSISTFLPNLKVLSMANSYLTGPIDPSLGKLEFLSVIRLDQNNLSSPVPDFIADFRNLTVLRLSSCNLNGTFPERIFQLPTLQTLDLTTNPKLHGSLPEFLDNTNSLQNLELSYTNFSGPLPNSIGRLMKLSRIELSNCNFSGNIPTSIINLTKLVYMDFSWNSFSGPIPSFQHCQNLTYLDLSRNSFSGPVPSSYFEGLQKLFNIDLRNNLFNGTVPSSMFSIPSLQKIQLSNNQFGDQIAGFSNPSSSLDTLDLSNNNVQGPIPKSFFKFRSLNILALSYNNFSGPLKLEEISNSFPNLTRLELSCNNLSIDANFTNDGFRLLTVLKLSSSKLKQFPDLRNHSRINILDLSDNKIGGEIPNWIWNFKSLLQLNLSSNSFVGMQKPYAIPISLSVLDLHCNQLGEIPIVLPTIIYLDYSSNNLGSSLPDEIGNNLTTASFFSLAKNRLSGVIPRSICKLTFLKVLDLSSNKFNGSIPSCLIEKSSLTLGVLNLQNNSLTGSITGIFPEKCALETLDLNGNLLEGKIPISLANCKDLEVLNLGNNNMRDIYPCFMKNSSSLRVLVLRRNHFNGNISCLHTGASSSSWQKLQIVDLALNQFNGTIPARCFLNWKGMANSVDDKNTGLDHLRFEFMKISGFYYQDTVTITNKGLQMELVKILTVFTSIDFSGNQLEGVIPSTVGAMKSLYVLNLSRNALTGPIPSAIGNLTQLGSLDLSRNKLTGTIPLQLLDLTFLSVLNLSYNKLTGMIPRGKQFSTFTETSFLGNPGLCGPIINVSCNVPKVPSDTSDKRSSSLILRISFDWQYIFTGMGFGIGAGLIVGAFFFCKPMSRWCDKHIEKFALLIIAGMGLNKKSENCFEDEETDDDSDEEKHDDEISERRYCIFCTRIDSNHKNVVHNPQCCCHDTRTPIYSFSSTTTSSSS